MKVTSKGQVTIPQHIRRFLKIGTHSEVEFRIENDSVILEAVDQEQTGTAQKESRFRKMQGSYKGDLTTEKWMAETRDSKCS